ncbi:MAG: DUF4328 domain-containing protein [Allosphingosinicella sp.]
MTSEYRDPGPLAQAAILWTWIWLGAQLLYGAASVFAFATLATLPGDTPVSMTASPPELMTSDLGLAISGLVLILTFFASGFLVLKWIHRVNSNAHVYSSEMNVSPGWNVGFFFIPIANLWKPFQGVRETWEVSFLQNREVPGWMRWWWGCWLATNFIGNASFRIALEAETAEGASMAALLDIVSAIVSVPLALLLIRLIRTLTSAQEAMHHGETFA